MPPYQRHIFVCTNQRDASDPKGCCSAKGSEEIRSLLKASLKARGLNKIVRANAAGCLDACAFGVTVVVYPEGVWYGGVTREDIPEILERHIVGGEVVERLRIASIPPGPSRLEPLAPPPAPSPKKDGPA